MWVESKRITTFEAWELATDWTDLDDDRMFLLHQGVKVSDPALAYWLNGDLVAMAGFIPVALITDTAYLWMQTTNVTHKYPLAVCRVGIQTLTIVKTRYPKIIGHCSQGPRSERWLESLGARWLRTDEAGRLFMIGGTDG
jgi:hypothetical protein